MEDKKIIGVYKIKNVLTDKYYIGYSQDINKRFKTHKNQLNRDKHPNIILQRSYNKYGIENFNFEIIDICETKKEACEKELEYLSNIEIRRFLYNMHYNNEGGDTLSNHPDKENIIKKRVETHNKNISKLTKEELVKKYGKFGEKNGMYGKTHTEEVKQKLRDKIVTEETRQKMRDVIVGEETRKKMSDNAKLRIGEKNPFYGKTHTEETKQKLRESSTGNTPITAVKIIIDNTEYESLTEAGKKLNLCPSVISWRIKSKNVNFINYKYSDETYVTKSVYKVIINDILYNSVSEACKIINHSKKYINKRLKSTDDKDKNWKYSIEKQERNINRKK